MTKQATYGAALPVLRFADTKHMGDVDQKTTGKPQPPPCLCTAVRQASRAVTRIYDAELRGAGLRSTQYEGRLGRITMSQASISLLYMSLLPEGRAISVGLAP
jgi:hypothetical protein